MTETTKANLKETGNHREEPMNSRLNWLRAGVLGANDGIVSIAGIVLGVAGATTDRTVIFTAGVAGLVAGALSMAGGEYVSVSSQKDAELSAIKRHQEELAAYPDEEEAELAQMYREKGLSEETAHQVARELTEKDALKAHAEIELGIDPDEPTSPLSAAFASCIAFTLGGILPFLAMLLPNNHHIGVRACAIAVVIALMITGYIGAYLGKAKFLPSILRNVIVGCLTMALTYYVGDFFGARA